MTLQTELQNAAPSKLSVQAVSKTFRARRSKNSWSACSMIPLIS